MPEQEPHIQPVLEGLSLSARLEKVRNGVKEAYFVTIDQIRKNEDGSFEGTVDAVDEFGLEVAKDVIILPEEIEWQEEGLLIHDEAEESDTSKKIVSKKVAALVGGATIAGTVAGIYIWNHKRKT